MLLNNTDNRKMLKVERAVLSISIILNIIGIILKNTIEATMIAAPATAIIPAAILLLISAILLTVYTFNGDKTTKYIFLPAIVLLIVKEFLWMGSIISILFYLIIVFSIFKNVQNKMINITIIVDCATKLLLTISYILNSIKYYGNIYYSMPTILCLLASFAVSTGIYLITHKKHS